MGMKKLLIAFVVVCSIAGQAFACAAITKKGTQCKRAPSPGSQYCWQHGGTTKAQRAVSSAPVQQTPQQSLAAVVQQSNQGSGEVVQQAVTSSASLPQTRNLTEEEWTRVRLEAIDNALASYKEHADGKVPMTLQKLRMFSSPSLSFKDGWGVKMRYVTDGVEYIVSSSGPDKTFDTEDDIASKGSKVGK